MSDGASSIVKYLNKTGLSTLWNRIDTFFARKTGEELKTLSVSGRVARADNNSKNYAKKIQIFPISEEVGTVNLCFCGKNILPNPGTQTSSGITFSYDDDGYLTVNGTATGQIDYYFVGTKDTTNGYEYFAPPGKYTFTLERVSGLGDVTFYLVASKSTGQTSDGTKVQLDNEGQQIYELLDGINCRIMLRVASGKKITNLKLKVQVEYGSIYSGYEPPYREEIPIDLLNNTVGVEDTLVIDENNSVKIIKENSEIDISGTYDFSKLKIPCFTVFNGVRNSSNNVMVEYYSMQLDTNILSNAELLKYLNGQPSTIIGNEPITTSNLNTLIGYLNGGGSSESTAVTAIFSIPEQETENATLASNATRLNITEVDSDGITFTSNTFSVGKKCTLKITGTARMAVSSGGVAPTCYFELYAYDGEEYTLLGEVSGYPSYPNYTLSLNVNANVEVSSATSSISLVAYTRLSGSGVATKTIWVDSVSDFSITEV